MNILRILVFLSSSFLFAQNREINDVKNNIYQLILNDVNKTNLAYPNKLVYLDNTMNKFNTIDLFSFDINLNEPEYKKDEAVCKIFNNVVCTDKILIDNFKLTKIYNEHYDTDYPDFYGIYAPLDHWYQYVYQTVNNNLSKDKIGVEEIIPVKHVFYRNGIVIIETLFYKFLINENGEIIQSNLIKY